MAIYFWTARDIEKNAALRFKNNLELKKQLAELKDLRGRMEQTLAKEFKMEDFR